MDLTLKDKNDIRGTNWIEFNVSGTETAYKYWAEDSKFLNEFAYDFYADIFEKAAQVFDYFGDTPYKEEQLVKLKQEIENRIMAVGSLQTLQDIIEFSNKTSYIFNLTREIEEVYKQSGNPHKLKDDLKKLGSDLMELLDTCIKQNKTLLVLC